MSRVGPEFSLKLMEELKVWEEPELKFTVTETAVSFP